MEISAVSATFPAIFPAFGLNFGGAVLEVLEITAPQGLPTMLSTYGYCTLCQFSPT